MGDFIVLEGKDYEKLVEEGMKKFQVGKDELHIEILESKKSLFASYFKIKISLEADKKIQLAENQISELLDKDLNLGSKELLFDYKPDGVYIHINKAVTMVDVVAQIDLKKINNVNLDKLKQAMEIGNYDNWIPIADAQEEKQLDSTCSVRVSPDFMQAHILVTEPVGGEDITEKAIYEALKEKGVVFNINQEEVRQTVLLKTYGRELLIAQGIEQQPGKDSELHYHFDASGEKTISIDKDGKVNYRELSLIKNVEKGHRLVTLIPGTKGIPGKTVQGTDISAKDGKKLALPRGKNTEISEDGLELIASIDGEVKLLDGKVNVFSVYEVKHNVDNSTGNIRFNGKVLVMGNVITGFEIEAEGDVEVYGVVEGAIIRSNGNIILHRGIQGMNKGDLYCEGDLIAKFIENSRIDVKGNIQSDAIMHSQIYCGKRLEATGRKGLLVGGFFKVSDEIKAKVIGSPMATVTEVEVGTNPDLRKKYDAVKLEQKQVAENLDKTAKAVDLLTKISKAGELPQDKKVLLGKSIQLKLQLSQKAEQLKQELVEMEKHFEELTKGKIKVSDVIYPGSRIIIGSSMMYIKDSMKYITFYRANAEIKILSYED